MQGEDGEREAISGLKEFCTQLDAHSWPVTFYSAKCMRPISYQVNALTTLKQLYRTLCLSLGIPQSQSKRLYLVSLLRAEGAGKGEQRALVLEEEETSLEDICERYGTKFICLMSL